MYSARTAAPDKRDQVDAMTVAMDAEQMKTVFYPMMQNRFGEDLIINDVDIHVLRNRNKRAVLRYKVTGSNGSRSAIEFRIIGKVYRAESAEKGYDNMAQLWENGFSRDTADGISMPEPLELNQELHMLFQEEVPGEALRMLVKQSPDPHYFKLLARGLAKLHQCPLNLVRKFMVKDHLLRCHPKHPFLAMALPEIAPKVEYIVKRAYEIEAELSDVAYTVFHGDFHLGQVHVENDLVWMIDFDTLSYGDPAADLGNMLVFLKGKARRRPAFQLCMDTFLTEYFSGMDPKIAERIPLYEALTHLRRACKRLRLQEDGWRTKAESMINEGVEAIDKMKLEVYG